MVRPGGGGEAHSASADAASLPDGSIMPNSKSRTVCTCRGAHDQGRTAKQAALPATGRQQLLVPTNPKLCRSHSPPPRAAWPRCLEWQPSLATPTRTRPAAGGTTGATRPTTATQAQPHKHGHTQSGASAQPATATESIMCCACNGPNAHGPLHVTVRTSGPSSSTACSTTTAVMTLVMDAICNRQPCTDAHGHGHMHKARQMVRSSRGHHRDISLGPCLPTCSLRSARLWASSSPVVSSAMAHALHVSALGGGSGRRGTELAELAELPLRRLRRSPRAPRRALPLPLPLPLPFLWRRTPLDTEPPFLPCCLGVAASVVGADAHDAEACTVPNADDLSSGKKRHTR